MEIKNRKLLTLATFKLKRPVMTFSEGQILELMFNFQDDRTSSGPYYELELRVQYDDEYRLPVSFIKDKEYLKLHECKLNDCLKDLGFGDWVTDLNDFNLTVWYLDVDKYLDYEFQRELAELCKLKFNVDEQLDDVRKALGKKTFRKGY